MLVGLINSQPHHFHHLHHRFNLPQQGD
uniref:Uncharacterized protein n=1 Tax=Tetranychus urticae TaxID=32264 RepID=T1KND0_TETUR